MTPEAVQESPPGTSVHHAAGLVSPVTAESPAPCPTGADPAAEEADRPTEVAEKICEGFVRHDRRDRDGAVAAFFAVDRAQFAHLEDEDALAAAEAFVDALWAKDAVEAEHVEAAESGTSPESFDDAGLAAADWSEVAGHLARRAAIVGMDLEYATATTVAWRRHKTGGDYWTPTLCAQAHEVRAAMDGEEAAKHRHGRSGFGHLPARYLVGLELHDMRTESHWKQAVAVMTPYFAEILDAHGGDR